MQLIGTVSEVPNDKGIYSLEVRKLRIPIRCISAKHAGKRVQVSGEPRWSKSKGSYFRVNTCVQSEKQDKNDVVVKGTIIRIMPEKVNARGQRSACIVVQQRKEAGTSVLVTALSSKVDDLNVDNLVVGDHIRLSGYMTYHSKGLHVLYRRTLREEISKKQEQ